MAPQAMVMNSAGKRKPLVATFDVPAAAVKPVNAGICRFVAAPMRDAPRMPMTASKIMPYSR